VYYKIDYRNDPVVEELGYGVGVTKLNIWLSSVAQSAAAVSLAKHVKDRTSKKPKSKSKQLKKKSK
jgi:hypothetical protein